MVKLNVWLDVKNGINKMDELNEIMRKEEAYTFGSEAFCAISESEWFNVLMPYVRGKISFDKLTPSVKHFVELENIRPRVNIETNATAKSR